MKRIFFGILAISLLFASVPANDPAVASPQNRQSSKRMQRKPRRYACPMHPEVISTKTGRCPKCSMSLRLVRETVAPESGSAAESVINSAPSAASGSNQKNDPPPFTSSRIPDVKVTNQNGKQLNFYSDLVKGRTVAINFIFTTCTAICPPLTATFRKLQQELGKQHSKAQLISISVDPATDTPERLHDFASKFNAEPGWTFITGEKAEIENLLRALGAAVANRNDHTPMILIVNDATGYWTRVYGLSPPATLVKVIEEAGAGN